MDLDQGDENTGENNKALSKDSETEDDSDVSSVSIKNEGN